MGRRVDPFRSFRRSFKVGDVITDGDFDMRIDYIGRKVVVMTCVADGVQHVYFEVCYRYRKVRSK